MLIKHTIKGFILYMACLLLSQVAWASQPHSAVPAGKYTSLKTVSGQWFNVYTSGPENSKKGILLIHGWWGLNEEVERWADQFGIAGYCVMAVDLYNSKVTTNPAEAKQLMNGVNQSEANEKYMSTIKALSAPGRKIAVIGRSYGANQALHAALVGQETISATIIYYPYGNLISDQKELSLIKTPILGQFARYDFFLTPDKLEHFISTVNKSGLDMTVNIYEAKHGFDNPAGKNFSQPAQKLAHDRTNQFLDKYLH